jgi:hypothetical protein
MSIGRAERGSLEEQIVDLQDSMDRVNRARLTSFLGGMSLMALLVLSLPALIPLLVSGKRLMRVVVGVDIVTFVLLSLLMMVSVPLTLRKVVAEFNRKVAEDKRARQAELEVQKILANLDERQYAVFNGLYRGYGDIDHVVIGPTGAFVVETKSSRGDVSLDNLGRLVIDGVDHPRKNYRRQAIQEAWQVKDFLSEHGVEGVFVQPLLALPRANVPDGLCFGTPGTAGFTPILGPKGILQYIYQHKASIAFTSELIERCRAALQSWSESPDGGGLETQY